eukprot:6465543-Amphidinium_carterae.4
MATASCQAKLCPGIQWTLHPSLSSLEGIGKHDWLSPAPARLPIPGIALVSIGLSSIGGPLGSAVAGALALAVHLGLCSAKSPCHAGASQ